jgi:hypothetical protein
MTSSINSSSGTTDYSVEDLEFDCDLLMSETEDINLNWMNVVFTKRRNQTKEETALNNAVDSHAKTMRYLSFAKSVIEVEMDKLSIKEIETEDLPQVTNSQLTLSDIPLSFTVRDIQGIDAMIAKHETQESRMRQLKKDVERDVLLMNGVRVSGAEKGLDSVLRLISDICDQIMKECDLKLLGDETKNVLSETILSVASRTHSGGITFQALHSMIDSSESMLIPQSAAARPIRVQISVGSFPTVYYNSSLLQVDSGSGQKWGVVCQVTCESVFQVQNRECPTESGPSGMESSSTPSVPTVRVTYQDYILLDLMQQVAVDYAVVNTNKTKPHAGDYIVHNTRELGTVSLLLE